MVFRRGGPLPSNMKFYYDGRELDIVNSFVYLGIVFTYTGIFTNAQKTVASQARKSMFTLIKYVGIFVSIKPSVCMELFDKLVKPVLMYSSEVWGFHVAKDIENLHTQFCKRVLRVKQSTPNDIVMAETRRVSMCTWRHLAILKYWVKMLSMDYIRNVYKMYCVIKSDSEDGKQNWVTSIRSLLYHCGLGHVWVAQSVGNEKVFISMLKQRLFDIYGQNVNSRLSNMSRGQYYLNINPDLNFINVTCDHFECVRSPRNMYSLITLCTCSHSIETGRWHKPHPIPLVNRLCITCGKLDDEYHFILECTRHSDLRVRYIPGYYITRPSMSKYVQLLTNPKCLGKLAIYIRLAFEHRGTD